MLYHSFHSLNDDHKLFDYQNACINLFLNMLIDFLNIIALLNKFELEHTRLTLPLNCQRLHTKTAAPYQ